MKNLLSDGSARSAGATRLEKKVVDYSQPCKASGVLHGYIFNTYCYNPPASYKVLSTPTGRPVGQQIGVLGQQVNLLANGFDLVNRSTHWPMG